MKPLALLFALTLAPVANAQDAGTWQAGLAAGRVWHDGDAPLQHGWEVMPRLGYFFTDGIAVEGELPIGFGAMAEGTSSWFSVGPRAHLIGYFVDDFPLRPYVLGGAEMPIVFSGGGGENVRSPAIGLRAYGGPGLQVNITEAFALRTDVRWGLTASTLDKNHRALSEYELTFGVQIGFGKKDSDKDGISDDDDACPTEPEDFDSFEDSDGCVDADNDGDGLADTVDQCRDEKEDPDGWGDDDGCPDPDNDGDGVLDGEDTCPNEAGTAATAGCPDKDGDLVVDSRDKCPDVAGTEALRGCPDTDGDTLGDANDECPTEAGPVNAFGCPDSDTDRVPNYRDACPAEAGNKEADPRRSDGCPSRVFATEKGITILDKVYFDSGKDTIQARSFPVLDAVAAVLAKYPDILKVEVAGHTDSQGDDAANHDLSHRRAQAVATYLTGKGIASERLVGVGYGETVAIDSNATSTGRANNRRVEFVILEQKGIE